MVQRLSRLRPVSPVVPLWPVAGAFVAGRDGRCTTTPGTLSVRCQHNDIIFSCSITSDSDFVPVFAFDNRSPRVTTSALAMTFPSRSPRTLPHAAIHTSSVATTSTTAIMRSPDSLSSTPSLWAFVLYFSLHVQYRCTSSLNRYLRPDPLSAVHLVEGL